MDTTYMLRNFSVYHLLNGYYLSENSQLTGVLLNGLFMYEEMRW